MIRIISSRSILSAIQSIMADAVAKRRPFTAAIDSSPTKSPGDRLKFSPERGRMMVLTLPVVFPHRRNRDGSFDSICLKCLLTIANARSETDLAKPETYHVCNPSILFQRAFDR